MPFHFHHHVTFGFAGKRNYKDLDDSRGPLRTLFEALDQKLNRTHVRLYSGLADGADQMAAQTFIELFQGRQKKENRAIGALLPFSETAYLQTITDKETFTYLYHELSDQKLELDGVFIAGKSKAAVHSRNKAYQQQGCVLAKICDVLIAIAPYHDDERPGGTTQTVLTALNLQKPVIFYDLKKKHFLLLNTIGDWFDKSLSPISPMVIAEALFPSKDDPVTISSETLMYDRVYRLRRTAWESYEYLFKIKKSKTKPQIKIKESNSCLDNFPLSSKISLYDLLETEKRKLDKPAKFFQYQYRGGYILNYMLALLAIFFAVCSSVILLEYKFIGEATHWLLAGIGLVKLLILVLLVINTKMINKVQYNKRAIDYRYAAERLRINAFMGILGILRSPKPSLGNHSKKHFAKYSGESMYQAAMRVPLGHSFLLCITTEKLKNFIQILKTEWVGRQLKYHLNETERMKRMEHELEKIPEALSFTVMGIVAFDLVAAFLFEIIKVKITEQWKVGIEILTPIMLGLTAFIPAVVTTLNSIHFQSDAHRLAERSAIMVSELKRIEHQIQKVEEQLNSLPEGSNFDRVLTLATETANLLTDEVAEWSLIYEKRVPDPG